MRRSVFPVTLLLARRSGGCHTLSPRRRLIPARAATPSCSCRQDRPPSPLPPPVSLRGSPRVGLHVNTPASSRPPPQTRALPRVNTPAAFLTSPPPVLVSSFRFRVPVGPFFKVPPGRGEEARDDGSPRTRLGVPRTYRARGLRGIDADVLASAG
ncbi:hypothetical protein AAFF_G00304780 [Aldrovandia affinis]|uniref:Uncharacterized protein n=1 Tax=Aldrovandia affinis TaxID=143900 RepID=A0AAD7SP28_9TELE|nr:hypothetical protein AAFF_G00304780 [Aldrovandia affinis]